MINLPTISILISYRQHFILIQCGTQRDISQRCIQCILVAAQQSSRLHLFIILTRIHAWNTLQDCTCLLYITYFAIRLRQSLIQRVCFVVWHSIALCRPLIIQHMLCIILSQIGKCHNIPGLIIITTLIGHPHFYSVNRYSTCDIGQSLHGLLIILAEIVAQKEVTILIITINWHFKRGCLCAASTRDRLALRILLRNQCLHTQLAKLQICLHTKQCRATAYQTVIQAHRHITRL